METTALSFTYAGAAVPALKDVTLAVPRGKIVLLCGGSGSGKSTLLRLLKAECAPHGSREGEIRFDPAIFPAGKPEPGAVGLIGQDPEGQIVTDRVWQELVFGLESLGMPQSEMAARVAETVSYFGLESLYRRRTDTLSGGQKQLVSLASVFALAPQLLLLDEPTAQLDPVAASDFFATLQRLNREQGTTILLSEHRLEEALPMADLVGVLHGGRLCCLAPPQQALEQLRGTEAYAVLRSGMPAAVQVFDHRVQPCPLTIPQGRAVLEQMQTKPVPIPEQPVPEGAACYQLRDVWLRYEKRQEDVLRGVDLTLPEGTCTAILGGNGSGKSTLLQVLCGMLSPDRGSVKAWGKKLRPGSIQAAYLPQKPALLFCEDTLDADYTAYGRCLGLNEQQREQRLAELEPVLALRELLKQHPYDLSGGQQQRAALGKLLLANPKILLLDEPTKGMDAAARQSLGKQLRALTGRGVTIVLATHDLDFAALYTELCGMLFDGQLSPLTPSRQFFRQNRIYTTPAHRMAASCLPEAVTCGDVLAALEVQA